MRILAGAGGQVEGGQPKPYQVVERRLLDIQAVRRDQTACRYTRDTQMGKAMSDAVQAGGRNQTACKGISRHTRGDMLLQVSQCGTPCCLACMDAAAAL